MIEFLNKLDMPSVYVGMISCMVFDVFLSFAMWFLDHGWEVRRLRKRITESPLNDVVVVDGNIKFHLQIAGAKDSYWTRGAYIPEAMSGTMYLCTNANIILDHSNVFKWNAFTFSLWNVASRASSISDISFVLLDENYNVLATLYERAFR